MSPSVWLFVCTCSWPHGSGPKEGEGVLKPISEEFMSRHEMKCQETRTQTTKKHGIGKLLYSKVVVMQIVIELIIVTIITAQCLTVLDHCVKDGREGLWQISTSAHVSSMVPGSEE